MGTRFDRWLSRPSTLCFLRRVLDITSSAPLATHLRPCVAIRRYAQQNKHHPPEDHEEEDGPSFPRGRYYRSSRDDDTDTVAAQKREDAAENALRRALGPRVGPTNLRSSFGETYTSLSGHLMHPMSSARLVRLVVDSPKHRSNLSLWAELAQNTQRHEGLEGVIVVWDGMRQHGVDLPTIGDDADILWTTFITSGIWKGERSDHRRFFLEVLQYAVRLKDRSGKVYPKLYQTAVGTFLSVSPFWAAKWARYIAEHLGEEQIDLNGLAPYCAASGAFKEFRAIYKKQGRAHKLYDHFIPELLKQRSVEQVLHWHKLFISNGDGPGAEVFAMQLVQELFERDGNKSLPMVHRRSSEKDDIVVPKDGVSIDLPSMTRATMSTLVGEVHGIKQREVSDAFVAKMFATRAFPLDMIVSGLGVIGVDRIGPLAMREIALRVGSASEFDLKLKNLQDMKLAINDAIYCRLLIKFAREGPENLYEALLATDEHPEAFEDSATQQALLASFLENGDLHHVKHRQFRLVADTTQQIQALDVVILGSTLASMYRYLLPERNAGHAPPQDMLDEYLGVPPLQFVTNASMYAAERGIEVRPYLWIELMKRYGMLQKWEELEQLVHWLPKFYRTRPKSYRTITLEKGRKVNINVPLWTIFSSSMRGALIVWGFRRATTKKLLTAADSPQTGHSHTWARGILLLKKLNEEGLHKPEMQTSPALLIPPKISTC
ncbi:hypothetical protein CKM354_000827600 [Cercospora kikuchii]|uniref:Uncharacterized protein n=1 Tax=Cercospora kikuchii TaxID=84275 RepID=A0A9P3FF44_9PEZI|nr:uncharacterized protein CKM354_000827600 [Cercospora kikuchii]GIZ45093.1 hypothetical protein CKM354_000827600 [Cercospora kikuchii]